MYNERNLCVCIYIKYFISYEINNTKKQMSILKFNFAFLTFKYKYIYFKITNLDFFPRLFWASPMNSPKLQIRSREFWLYITRALSAEFSLSLGPRISRAPFPFSESLWRSLPYTVKIPKWLNIFFKKIINLMMSKC